MSQQSHIEWTDATWNPVRGCTKVSPGCANCYAETFAERFRGVTGHPYEQGFDLRLVPEKLMEPLSWQKPRRVFVNSMSDLFQDGVPDQFITDVFGVMGLAHWHTFQVLTKRPLRMLDYLTRGDHGIVAQFEAIQAGGGISTRQVFNAIDIKRRDGVRWQWPLPNVWLGVSVENQHFADERIPLLLQTPAAVRFISAEPLLEAVNLKPGEWMSPRGGGPKMNIFGLPVLPSLDWVIVGGESGHGARSFNLDWARLIVAQCHATGTKCFVKQLGMKPFEPYSDGTPFAEPNYKSKKGGDPSEWPADLRVREFPGTSA
jgi:protein gp37